MANRLVGRGAALRRAEGGRAGARDPRRAARALRAVRRGQEPEAGRNGGARLVPALRRSHRDVRGRPVRRRRAPRRRRQKSRRAVSVPGEVVRVQGGTRARRARARGGRDARAAAVRVARARARKPGGGARDGGGVRARAVRRAAGGVRRGRRPGDDAEGTRARAPGIHRRRRERVPPAYGGFRARKRAGRRRRRRRPKPRLRGGRPGRRAAADCAGDARARGARAGGDAGRRGGGRHRDARPGALRGGGHPGAQQPRLPRVQIRASHVARGRLRADQAPVWRRPPGPQDAAAVAAGRVHVPAVPVARVAGGVPPRRAGIEALRAPGGRRVAGAGSPSDHAQVRLCARARARAGGAEGEAVPGGHRRSGRAGARGARGGARGRGSMRGGVRAAEVRALGEPHAVGRRALPRHHAGAAAVLAPRCGEGANRRQRGVPVDGDSVLARVCPRLRRRRRRRRRVRRVPPRRPGRDARRAVRADGAAGGRARGFGGRAGGGRGSALELRADGERVPAFSGAP